MSAPNIAAVLRAEALGLDLEEGPYGIHVFAVDEPATRRVELGHVSYALIFQDPDMARAAIERIKFAERTQEPTP